MKDNYRFDEHKMEHDYRYRKNKIKQEYRYNKRKMRNIKRTRSIILFIIIVIFVVGSSALMSLKFSESKETVQAIEVNQEKNSGLISKDNNGVKQEKNLESTDKDNLNDENKSNSDSYSLENDPVADDVTLVEKYLYKQMRREKLDAADDKKVVYLTFDDGPSETVTPRILDILKTESVHATFFVTGQALDKSDVTKNLIKREIAEGNAIGNHTYSHNYKYLYPQRTVSVDNFMADIDKTNQSLKNILGTNFSTRVIRFPGGHMSWKGMAAIDKVLKEKDYHYVDWNALTKDAEGARKNAAQLKQELINTINTINGKQKAVILMHDTYGKEETAKALPEVIKYLKEQGYEFKIIK